MSRNRRFLAAATAALLGLLVWTPSRTGVRAEEQYGPTPLPKVDKPAVPKIEFDSERYDYGELIQGDPAVHTFRVKNTGHAVLKLLEVKPGCSCTISEDWKQFKEIPPGGEGTITLQVKTDKFKSGQKTTKSADVQSNDPMRPKVKISMSGMVKRILDWSPADAKFEALAGKPISGELELIVPSGVALDIEKVSTASKILTLGELQVVEAGKRWKVGINAPTGAGGPIKKENMSVAVKLETDKGVREMKIPVPISLRSLDRVQFDPKESVSFNKKETASLGSADAKPVQRTVAVSSGDPEVSFKVTRVEVLDVPAGLFETQVIEVTPGNKYNVLVTLKEKVDQKFVRGKLVVHTDDSSCPTKEMRLFAQFDVKK